MQSYQVQKVWSLKVQLILTRLPVFLGSGCPKEPLYVDDFALVVETHEDLKGRLESLKGAMESKGLRAVIKKKNMLISCENAEKVTLEGKFL